MKKQYLNKTKSLTSHCSNFISYGHRGITLIALVITIIVMLILAAVTISMAINGGLFGYAQNASQETTIARDQELELGKGIVDGKTIDEWVNGEETISPTDIYALACENGTLVLSNNVKAIEDYMENNNIDKADGYEIKNIVDDVYYYNDDSDYNFPYGYGDTNITTVQILNKIVPKSTTMVNGFWSFNPNISGIENLSNLDTRYITDMSWMFAGLESLTSLDLSHFNTSNATNMEGMFAQSGFTTLDLSNFDTSKVTNMLQLVDNCPDLSSLNINNFNFSALTGDVYGGLCSINDVSLRTLSMENVTLGSHYSSEFFIMSAPFESISFSVADVENFTSTYSMFYNLDNLKYLDLSKLNTSNVTNMEDMFLDSENLEIIYVSELWNVSNVNDSDCMFEGCSKLPNYDSNVLDKTNAHYNTGGYLTYKQAT